jgi:hypothetical protein
MSRRQKKTIPQPKSHRKAYVSVFSVVVIVVMLYFLWPKPVPVPASPIGGVTIVDSFYSSTPKFTDDAVTYIKSQGLKADIYKEKNITVDFYKKLPTYSNSILVLRVHSGTLNITGTPRSSSPLSCITRSSIRSNSLAAPSWQARPSPVTRTRSPSSQLPHSS